MIVVIDYQAGNLHNVARALRFLGYECRFSDSPDVIGQAERIILPGVGSARTAMRSLQEKGLVEVLRRVPAPFLGICLGMQLLFDRSEEESIECLGVVPGEVRRFDSAEVKVPHIGWNQAEFCGPSGLFHNLPDKSFFYFVHSFYAPASSPAAVAITDYSVPFASAVSFKNYSGVQFHPELSGDMGLKLLKNFLEQSSL